MGIDLRMEPFAEMYQAKCTRSGILDEFYFQDVDWLFERLGLTWDDYSAVDELDDKGRFPHEAVLKLSQATTREDAKIIRNSLMLIDNDRRLFNSPTREELWRSR